MDFNGKADQYRWLGTGGTRWGLDDDEDGKIDRWKQISAEEVSAEVIAAFANADPARFARLLISDSEIEIARSGARQTNRAGGKSRPGGARLRRTRQAAKALGPEANGFSLRLRPLASCPAGNRGFDQGRGGLRKRRRDVRDRGTKRPTAGRHADSMSVTRGDWSNCHRWGVTAKRSLKQVGNFFTPGGAIGGPAWRRRQPGCARRKNSSADWKQSTKAGEAPTKSRSRLSCTTTAPTWSKS